MRITQSCTENANATEWRREYKYYRGRRECNAITTEGEENANYTEWRREYKYYRGCRECNALSQREKRIQITQSCSENINALEVTEKENANEL